MFPLLLRQSVGLRPVELGWSSKCSAWPALVCEVLLPVLGAAAARAPGAAEEPEEEVRLKEVPVPEVPPFDKGAGEDEDVSEVIFPLPRSSGRLRRPRSMLV